VSACARPRTAPSVSTSPQSLHPQGALVAATYYRRFALTRRDPVASNIGKWFALRTLSKTVVRRCRRCAWKLSVSAIIPLRNNAGCPRQGWPPSGGANQQYLLGMTAWLYAFATNRAAALSPVHLPVAAIVEGIMTVTQGKPAKRSLVEFLKDVGLFLAAPFISLVYMAMFPFIGLVMLVRARRERSKHISSS
jgi:hypothetical protein